MVFFPGLQACRLEIDRPFGPFLAALLPQFPLTTEADLFSQVLAWHACSFPYHNPLGTMTETPQILGSASLCKTGRESVFT